MALTLPTIRYYTVDSPYHFSEDNKPLEDLASRDVTLANAIDALNADTRIFTAAGSWAAPLTVSIDLSIDLNKAFAYKIKLWAIQDQTLLATQVSTVLEDLLIGHNTSGTVAILTNTNLFKYKAGVPTLTQTYTGSSNNLVISFSGYTGANGYVIAKAERFGI
jgi:hypothetical protein